MKNYLSIKGYDLKVESGQDVAKTCPFCQDDGWHFYIDPDTSKYFCHKCNAKGNEVTLKKHFQDYDNTRIASFKQAIGQKETKKPPEHGRSQLGRGYLASRA